MPKVFLMLSGGVDSSVAALMLKNQGFEVVGIFMKCWSMEQLKKLGLSEDLYACNWEDDQEDARLVAKKLDITFLIWDLEEEYRSKIIDYMIDEYKNGRTPNPDVMCNSLIKFGVFYDKALQEKADFVATGHYARSLEFGDYLVRFENNSKNFNDSNFIHKKDLSKLPKYDLKARILGIGLDLEKDQTYFLWKINPSKLSRILLPIGKFETKAKVRQKAQEFGLINANKKDSQGLCFVGKTPLRELLKQTIGQKSGNIVEENSGKILGKHEGAFLYTIGQRQQLGLSGGPWFVTKIEVKENLVYVTSNQNQQTLYSKKLVLDNCNWQISNILLEKTSQNLQTLLDNLTIKAQIRYHQNYQECLIKTLDLETAEVEFLKPVKAAALGQSVVFYTEEIMLGGGIIKQSLI